MELRLDGAYFLSLSLENVKCFGPKVKIDFSDADGRPARWTVILGENGVGKTTVLRSLALCETTEEGYLENGVYYGGAPKYRNNFGWIFPKGTKHPGKLDFGLSNTSMSVEGNIDEDGSLRVISESVPGGQERKTKVIGFGASRKMSNGGLSTDLLGEIHKSLFEEEALLINAEEFFLQIDYAHKTSGSKKTKEQRDRVKSLLIDLLPEVKDIRTVKQERGIGRKVEFHTPYGWVRLADLSLGYKTLISWMVDLAAKMYLLYPESSEPLKEPAIVLVDEIDLHMHPRWQRNIMDYLSEHFPNTQFIVTAHSPLIVQAASDANIVLLKRVGDHVEVENDPKVIRNWRVDQILASDLFGIPTRPEKTERLLDERRKILSQKSLSKKDEARLFEIESEMGDLPTGESMEELEAMDLIKEMAAEFKKKKKS